MSKVMTSQEVMDVVFHHAFEMSRKALPEGALTKGKLELGRDFGLDSLDSMQLCLELESYFDLDLDDSISWRKLQDIADSIELELASKRV